MSHLNPFTPVFIGGILMATTAYPATHNYTITPICGVRYSTASKVLERFSDVSSTHIHSAESVEARFSSLSKKWKEEIGPDSSLSRILSNKNYLSIIALKNEAVPFILRDLKMEPAPWFAALAAITGREFGDENDGDFTKMAQLWINWGEKEKII
jgi:hypothetical protein